MNTTGKFIEPFNLFGERALIDSKDEAAQIVKDNSCYFFVSALLLLAVCLTTKGADVGVSKTMAIIFGTFYVALAVAMRRLKSRLAAVLASISIGYVMLSRLLSYDIGWSLFFSIVYFAASYRAIRASFFYHRKENKEGEISS